MIDKDYTRSALEGEAVTLFDNIVFSRVLGASKHTEMIGQMLLSIVDHPAYTAAQTVERLRTVAGFFKETRGQNSRAIYNAINMMTKGLAEADTVEIGALRNQIRLQINSFKTLSDESIRETVAYGAKLCEGMDAILIFDYSSTVNAFIKALHHPTKVYIPESRALDGGKPFVKAALAAGHEVHFIPDTTMMQALSGCQAAIMGAETLYPDGSVFNTIGSDILGVVCKAMGLPLYVLSPLLKVDTRPVYGYNRLAPMPYDYGQRIAKDWSPEERAAVDFSGIKLVKVSADYISAIISEKGIIPARTFFDTAMHYSEQLERGI